MCKWGTYTTVKVTIPTYLSHTGEAFKKTCKIDSCIAPIVKALEEGGIMMTASCCGHGKADGRIDLLDGRTLMVLGVEQ